MSSLPGPRFEDRSPDKIPPVTLRAGERFASYTIVRQLGSGGMGEVYLAQHPRLPRQEAVKVLRPEISGDSTFRQRFIREADSVASLEHPNIVTVYDRGETDGQLWIATQYVDGTDAAKLLRDRYPAGMTADDVADVTTAIAAALDHAHDRGVLHRDVKPANILLSHPDRDGVRRVFLADFGIARPFDDPAGLTATNFTLGTVAYAAPEQLMGNAIDGRSDQYALAATAYHLLTGTTMFGESSPIAVISRQLTEQPPAPSTVNPGLAPFDAVFARALAKDPGHRFPRCQDFARALNAALTSTGLSSPTAETQQARIPHATEPAQSVHRTARTATILGALMVGLLLAAGLMWWQPWVGQPHQETGPDTPPTSIVSSPAPATPPSPATTGVVPPPPPPVTTTPPPPPAPSTPPSPKYPPAGALGEWCTDHGGTGMWSDGTIVYCSRLQGTDGYQWSLSPDVIHNPALDKPLDIPPGSICMVPGSTVDTYSGPLTCRPYSPGTWRWLP